MCNMPSADEVWGAVLREHWFVREAIPRCITAADFCREHPQGVYVLAFGGHVATVWYGTLYDSWNSENETPIYYYRRL